MTSTTASTGSPVARRPVVGKSQSQENFDFDEDRTPVRNETANTLKKSASALTTSKLANQAPKKIKMAHISSFDSEANPMDKLLARLSEQQATITKQHASLASAEDDLSLTRTFEYITASSSSSVPITPATEAFEGTAPTNSPISLDAGDRISQTSTDEVLRLKLELEKAKGKIARMDQELTQTRITKHTIEQAIGSASEADFPLSHPMDTSEARHGNVQHSLDSSLRPQCVRDNSWTGQDDGHSDTSEALSASGFNRARAIWGNANRQPYSGFQGGMSAMPGFQAAVPGFAAEPWMGRGFCQQFSDTALPYGPSIPALRSGCDRLVPEQDPMLSSQGDRRNPRGGRLGNRNQSGFPYSCSNSSYEGLPPVGGYGSVAGTTGSINGVGMGSNGSMGYQPQPIGTPLSPFAPEFTSTNGGGWKNEAIATEGQTYLPTTEPLNYRRLLDRTVNCNWKYIVDKIVCNNDQQASIFLQQKLKVGTTEQKYDIVEAIVAQAYPLMVNRFGNFLVQRCFEHGTPEQVIKIAEAIRGNTLNLSMDAFGCHVVQKAFDSVPEDYKAIMVHELLRRIPETVIHRYACHVWQKLFELRWTESPPQIMKYVNEALRGMWHEVALGETGSLVVQNIFENCLEEDKRPCIEEVLASIDIVAHGQFGNWCIQHICEHGAPADRSRAIDHVIRYASEYSMDQFASKVVEKCLKIGGVEFLSRYLDRVCEGRLDRPRIPLIDIASDQYGNYLIQYILTHSNPQHRETVACHIRKHMVSLRGSKFGSRVGMLCTNPAIATRPGPGVGPAIGTRMTQPGNTRYGGSYR
ncbi:MAG: hypothetical protein M1818_003975 [Claussenomyces sp. TS43310]|nr:MAG: hypothetical protein M1818_003975 [Claussenomyces sp. TS43310]